MDPDGYVAADQYIRELMWEQAKRHRNLRPGDVCMMLYESKVMGNYRLCRVTAAEPSEDGCTRTVTVGYLPRKSLKQTVYRPVPLETKDVAIQRLVLLVPIRGPQISYRERVLPVSLPVRLKISVSRDQTLLAVFTFTT